MKIPRLLAPVTPLLIVLGWSEGDAVVSDLTFGRLGRQTA
jgi:hypothetical protein